ncbi:MAG: Triheme cytochrome c, partial [Nitrospinaceae bacterium]|nr:Triheme cytochrome c [Nitrospinaceae bacterium]NIR56702.1 Triheme cytochrome c [Nitrospinaceae bacterium]NIT84018.1 Triheme cytochrome c [Nitrospinaceae bacterium]NIX36371.1 Triheme cytochrome c [Nitrospinaceae bacterium]NIY17433.1 Triheme cytochrome c [Nitrospinaceae bacterium]
KGGHVGPPLTIVGTTRTQPFLLESILNPKAVITVGYSSILILTKKGKFITGVKVNEDDSSIDLVDKEGSALHIPKTEIKKFKTQKISIMPGNFKDILTPDEVRHLLAYLGTLHLQE